MSMNQTSTRASNNNSRSLRRVSVRESQQEEPIYFDQTTRHIGSVQKNMIFSLEDQSLMQQMGGARQNLGFAPTSTLPNYPLMVGQQNATYMVDPR